VHLRFQLEVPKKGFRALLQIVNVSARYGAIQVLRRVTFHVQEGEIVALIGANGAGKSTLLRVISGLHRASQGDIVFQGTPIQRLAPERIVRAGLVQVPEARQLFPNLTVLENLQLGGALHGRKHIAEALDRMFALFPVLAQRLTQKAGTLSGGEQQMLSVARALMARPRLLILDEPSLGLAPLVVEEIYAAIRLLHSQGTTILLVEQNAMGALGIAQRAYVLETGRIVLAGAAAELLEHDEVQRAYLGKDYRYKWEK
jgi:branched-chain amino acid transport system ATP-binding protein